MNNTRKCPNSFTVVRAVGWVTFLEVLRDKILYNILLIAALLLSVGVLASKLTFIHPERVVLDFGLTSVVFSCGAVAVFSGAGLLSREVERRTILMALSRPISRIQFIVGKFCGMVWILKLNWVLLSIAYLLILGFTTSGLDQGWMSEFSPILGVALVLILLQSLLMASMAVFFSTFSTTSLSAILCLGFFLIGNNITQIRFVADKATSPITQKFLRVLATVLPNFEYFSLGTRVTYGLPVHWQAVGWTVLYGVSLVAFFLAAGGFLVRSREI
jgi:Cu-processing system permease protein